MQLKLALGLLALGLLLAGAMVVRRTSHKPSADNQAVTTAESVQQETATAPTSPKVAGKASPATDALAMAVNEAPANPESLAARHEAYVAQRLSELQELSTQDDATSLNTILSELTNREPEIRKAALEAAIQFGSPDAIPSLQEALLQTDDPHEKAALAEAIEFLKLPSLRQALQAASTGSMPSGQAAEPNTPSPEK